MPFLAPWKREKSVCPKFGSGGIEQLGSQGSPVTRANLEYRGYPQRTIRMAKANSAASVRPETRTLPSQAAFVHRPKGIFSGCLISTDLSRPTTPSGRQFGAGQAVEADTLLCGLGGQGAMGVRWDALFTLTRIRSTAVLPTAVPGQCHSYSRQHRRTRPPVLQVWLERSSADQRGLRKCLAVCRSQWRGRR